MRSAWTAAPNCCHGSTMALAIFSACSSPRTLPNWSMPLRSRPASLAKAPSTWAPSPPKASVSLAPAEALVRSPSLPCSLSMMSRIGSILPCWSVNLSPSFSDAAPMFSNMALYRPPASPPSMVLLRVPITAICSARSTPAVVAIAPASLKASFIAAPLVRNN